MDEKGIQFGGGRKNAKKYFHISSMKRGNFYRVRSDNLELMTVIECVSPSGLTIPPSFILSDGPTPVPSAPIGAIGTSQNGWTDNELGAAWFKDQFIPFANSQKVSDDPIVLFVDGHDSHESEAFQNSAFESGIIAIAFPSKCTHKLQPLDVVVFSQTQRQWSKHCDRRLYEGVQMDRYNIVDEYMSVRSKSMTPKLLRSAFAATGIFPFNPNIFSDEDFAPAKSSSLSMHLPKDFPPEVASSSPIASDVSDLEIDSDDESDTEAEATKVCFSEIDWSTDTDDYEPQASPSTAPPSPSAMHTSPLPPASLADAPSMSNYTHASLLPQNTLPTSVTSDHPSPHSHPSSSNCPSAIIPMSGTRVEHESNYFTRSQASQNASKQSSLAVSISIALDPSRAPIPESYDELRTEVCRLRMENCLIKKEMSKSKAVINATNAHCTIMTRAASASKAESETLKRKTRRSVKTNARLISHPMLIEKHKADLEAKALRAREAAKVEAEKATEEALREARIQEEIRTRTFAGESNTFFTIQHLTRLPEPLSSYKRKDDLIALSGALGLKTSGTINELTGQLRAHLAAHPEIEHDARFSGIFLTRRRRVENVISLDE
jgi:hypothetical protein